mgnify:CR=1 FL=1
MNDIMERTENACKGMPEGAASVSGEDLGALVRLLFMTKDRDYRPAAIRRIATKYGLSYRTAKGLSRFAERPAIREEDLAAYSDPAYYTLDNCAALAETGDPSLTELIPAQMYEDERFLEMTGIDEIPDSFAEGDDAILAFTVRKQIRRIGSRAFAGCSHIIDVAYSKESSLEEIGALAFRGCERLRTDDLPPSVRSIGEASYSGCLTLTSFTLPAQVREIRPYTFSGCVSLATVSARSGSVRLGECAFKDCPSLADVGGVIEEIGSEALAGCSGLKKAVFDCALISKRACAGCSSLRSIHFRTPPVMFDRDCFIGCGPFDSVTVSGPSSQLHSADGSRELGRHIRNPEDPGSPEALYRKIMKEEETEITGGADL